MNEKLAMELFENGEAFGVLVNTILMEAHGRVYFSIDGHRWYKTDHPVLKECLNGAKALSRKNRE